MNSRKINSNIWKLFVIKAICNFMLIIPVIVLFFQENGLSMKEIFLLQALFSLSLILWEIPSGYFSDIFGRKRSILIGGAVMASGFVVYSLSYSFLGFLIAELLLGLGASFISGTDVAMIYDTLAEIGEEGNYKKIQGRIYSGGLLSESASAILGGLLALISLRFPLYCDAAVTILIIPVAMTLVEPKRQKIENGDAKFGNLLKVVKYSLYENKKVKWLIIYSSVVGASTLTMVWFIQPFLSSVDFPLGLFGIFWSSLMLFSAFISWNVSAIEKFLGKSKALLVLIALPAAGYFIIGSLPFGWIIIFIFLFYFVRGMNDPIMLDHINGIISSDVRATILSVKHLVGRIIFAIVGPIAGWISDSFSIQAALLVSGSIFLFLGLISLVFLKKQKIF